MEQTTIDEITALVAKADADAAWWSSRARQRRWAASEAQAEHAEAQATALAKRQLADALRSLLPAGEGGAA